MTDKDKKKKPAAAPEQADRSTELTAIKSDGEGVIQIANDVVSNIAGLAVMEIEGVSKLTGNITKELITKLGRKSLSKGIKLNFSGSELTVDVSIEVKFGYNIVEVSKSVQDRVKSNVNTMTGLKVSAVNVRVSGIDMDADDK
ncbi:MAG TPA: Asp23/Gls24 family envelope stress response protein [Lachnospiraceae bacterium]|nr:Asp23/Gls24 family envelope stress response protein [Lachnospiraceae bacterium]